MRVSRKPVLTPEYIGKQRAVMEMLMKAAARANVTESVLAAAVGVQPVTLSRWKALYKGNHKLENMMTPQHMRLVVKLVEAIFNMVSGGELPVEPRALGARHTRDPVYRAKMTQLLLNKMYPSEG